MIFRYSFFWGKKYNVKEFWLSLGWDHTAALCWRRNPVSTFLYPFSYWCMALELAVSNLTHIPSSCEQPCLLKLKCHDDGSQAGTPFGARCLWSVIMCKFASLWTWEREIRKMKLHIVLYPVLSERTYSIRNGVRYHGTQCSLWNMEVGPSKSFCLPLDFLSAWWCIKNTSGNLA